MLVVLERESDSGGMPLLFVSDTNLGTRRLGEDKGTLGEGGVKEEAWCEELG